jgi:nanoRNase/pAp phosphatase (c-di-AMP/oligoRNAs hydrolase)
MSHPSNDRASGYTTNATPAEIAATLRAAKRVLITTHSKPDGDAAGSSLAIARALKHIGVTPEVWHVGPFQAWLKPIAGDMPIRRLSPDTQPNDLITDEPDAIVITDTGSWVQLEAVTPFLKSRAAKTIVIDHHLNGDTSVSARRLVDTTAAAATEVVVRVIDELLGLTPDAPLPTDIATMLYLGLATDTGWFKFSSTTPATMRLGARLLDSGVDHPALYELISQQDAPARPLLLGRALSSLIFEAQGKIGVVSITAKDIQDCKAGQEDTGGFAEPVMSVIGVQVVAVFTDATRAGDLEPTTKISMRSKPGPNAVDVSAVAATLGGGGHARAAGLKLKLPLERAREAVLNALKAKV